MAVHSPRPVLQEPRIRGDLPVRTAEDPIFIGAAGLDEARRFNPEIRVARTTPLDRLVDESIVQEPLLATLSGGSRACLSCSR